MRGNLSGLFHFLTAVALVSLLVSDLAAEDNLAKLSESNSSNSSSNNSNSNNSNVSAPAFNHDVYQVLGIDPATKEASDIADDAHELIPILRYAFERYGKIGGEIHDYRCKMVKRERIQGKLLPKEVISLKLRHNFAPEEPPADVEKKKDSATVPFSVYMKFASPKLVAGREVVYVQGENHDLMTATRGGATSLRNLTLSLPPNDPRAMRANNFPLTDIGVLNLTHKVIEEGVRCVKADSRHECIVNDVLGAKINKRPCRYIQLKFPKKREGLKFHLAQIMIDEELGIPVRFAAYYWPKQPQGKPRLLVEYTYYDLETNVEFGEMEFSRENPEYGFFNNESSE